MKTERLDVPTLRRLVAAKQQQDIVPDRMLDPVARPDVDLQLGNAIAEAAKVAEAVHRHDPRDPLDDLTGGKAGAGQKQGADRAGFPYLMDRAAVAACSSLKRNGPIGQELTAR
jgi:hypothetical protein